MDDKPESRSSRATLRDSSVVTDRLARDDTREENVIPSDRRERGIPMENQTEESHHAKRNA
jgi:hypothetical protein